MNHCFSKTKWDQPCFTEVPGHGTIARFFCTFDHCLECVYVSMTCTFGHWRKCLYVTMTCEHVFNGSYNLVPLLQNPERSWSNHAPLEHRRTRITDGHCRFFDHFQYSPVVGMCLSFNAYCSFTITSLRSFNCAMWSIVVFIYFPTGVIFTTCYFAQPSILVNYVQFLNFIISQCCVHVNDFIM